LSILHTVFVQLVFKYRQNIALIVGLLYCFCCICIQREASVKPCAIVPASPRGQLDWPKYCPWSSVSPVTKIFSISLSHRNFKLIGDILRHRVTGTVTVLRKK